MKIDSVNITTSLSYNGVSNCFEKKTVIKIEESRLEIIKKEIENGTYKVDLNKIAEAIAKTL